MEDQTVPGLDGGYFITTQANPKEFTLNCYLEDMTEKQRWNAIRWLDRNTSGELTLDESPYVTYQVRPTEKPEFEVYKSESLEGNGEVYNGTVTITFTAYDPKGKLTLMTLPGDSLQEEERTLAETGLIAASQMPYTPGNNITSTSQLIYNPGTKLTPARLLFKGTAGNGITVRNAATGSELQIKNLPSGVTAECEIAYDAEFGTTRKYYGGADHEFAYLYHDGGYLSLAPCNLIRDVVVSGTSGSREITSDGAFTKTMIGQYIYINGGWYFIGSVADASHATLNTSLGATVTNVSTIAATLNLITIEASTDSVIDSLRIEFTPRV